MKLTFPTVAIACCLASPAYGQDTRDEDADIVVTGERTPRTIIETSSSLAVTTQEDLDRFAGADTLSRILEQTANVSPTGDDNEGPSIRGVNSSGILTSVEAFFGGSQPRLTVQVDGRQLSFNEFVFAGASAWDIERVEIFRGPQTTTQGRNAIAGAIFVETADPDHEEFEGRARAIVGGRDERQLSGLVSGPIGSGDLAFRVSGDYRQEESFVQPVGVPDYGIDLRRVESLNVRGKLDYRPAALPGFSALLTVSHADTQRPQTESVDAPFFDRERDNPGFSVFTTNGEAAILEVAYDTGDGAVFSNTATFSRSDVERLAPVGTGNAQIRADEFTNEFTARFGDGEAPLRALVGSYVSHTTSEDALDLTAFELGVGTFAEERDSFGVFGEVTVSPAAHIHLTGGLRYQWDAQDRDGGFADIIPIDFDRSFDALLPRAELAFDLGDQVRIGVMAERGFNPGGFTFNFDSFSIENFARELVWNYEAFAKARVLEGRLLLTGNVFYSDFEDYQVASLTELGPGFFANSFSNVADARAQGAEFGARYQAGDALFLDISVGLLDTELQADSSSGALVNGNDFERAPSLTATGGIAWQPLPGLELSGFARYSDGYASDAANIRANVVGDYIVADVQASYSIGPMRLFAYATNVLGSDYELSIFSDGTIANIGDPRRVSAGVEFSF